LLGTVARYGCSARGGSTRLLDATVRHGCSTVLADGDALPSDLVARILSGNVGASTFAQACMVSRTWREACTRDEALLRAVALYSGGLTKSAFGGLFALYPDELRALSHTKHAKRGSSQMYYMFAAAAVDEALCMLGGVQGWCVRLSSPEYRDYVDIRQHILRCKRAHEYLGRSNPWSWSGKRRARLQWHLDEMYHCKKR
jgi:hypothetical protein